MTDTLTCEDVLRVVLTYVAENWTSEEGGISGQGEALLAATFRLLGVPDAAVTR